MNPTKLKQKCKEELQANVEIIKIEGKIDGASAFWPNYRIKANALPPWNKISAGMNCKIDFMTTTLDNILKKISPSTNETNRLLIINEAIQEFSS